MDKFHVVLFIEDDVEILEIDELFTFVKKSQSEIKNRRGARRTYSIWGAVDLGKFKVIAFKIGNGDKSNFIKLAFEIEKNTKPIPHVNWQKSI